MRISHDTRDRRRSQASREARLARRATEQAAQTARTIASIEAQVGPVEDRIDWEHVDHLRALIGLPPQNEEGTT